MLEETSKIQKALCTYVSYAKESMDTRIPLYMNIRVCVSDWRLDMTQKIGVSITYLTFI